MICGIANNRQLSFLIKPFSSFCLVYISHVGHSVKTQAIIPSEQVLLTSQRPFSLYILVIVRNDSSIYQKLYEIQNGKYFQHVWLPTSRDVKITWLREPICRRTGWGGRGSQNVPTGPHTTVSRPSSLTSPRPDWSSLWKKFLSIFSNR